MAPQKKRPATVGRWRVAGPLRGGGQAMTFLVSDTRGERSGQCVLKQLRFDQRRLARERFRQEVETLQGLHDRRIVPIIDAEAASRRSPNLCSAE